MADNKKLIDAFTKVAEADGWKKNDNANIVEKRVSGDQAIYKTYDFDSQCLIYSYGENLSVTFFSALSYRAQQEAEVLRQRFFPDLPSVGQAYPHEVVEAVTKKINPSYSSGPM